MFKKSLLLVCLAANSILVCQASNLANDPNKVSAKSIESLRRQIDKIEASNAKSPALASLMDSLSASYKSVNQPDKARFWELKANELKGIAETPAPASTAEVLGAGFETHTSARTIRRLKNLIPAAGM